MYVGEVWSPWTWIYRNNEDTWRADAQIYTDANPVTWCGVAWGDWHRYTDGAEFERGLGRELLSIT